MPWKQSQEGLRMDERFESSKAHRLTLIVIPMTPARPTRTCAEPLPSASSGRAWRRRTQTPAVCDETAACIDLEREGSLSLSGSGASVSTASLGHLPADAAEEPEHVGVAYELATLVPHGLDELEDPDGGICRVAEVDAVRCTQQRSRRRAAGLGRQPCCVDHAHIVLLHLPRDARAPHRRPSASEPSSRC